MMRTMSEYAAGIDPQIVDVVETLRDRYGVSGLRAAAWLIAGEIERTAMETEAAFSEAE